MPYVSAGPLPPEQLALPEGHPVTASATRGVDEQINLGGEGGLLALPEGRTVTVSATRGVDEQINLGGEGGLLALPEGRTIRASATRGVDEQINLGGEGGLLALPEGRTIRASATRGVDEQLNLGGEGGLLALPEGRTISASANREKEKKARLVAKRIKPSTNIDLTGCWMGAPAETSLVQSGNRIVATIPDLNSNGKIYRLIYTGTFAPPVLNLAHRYTLDTLRTYTGAESTDDRMLLTAGVERRYRLRVYTDPVTGGEPLSLKGTWQPMSHFFDFKPSESGFGLDVVAQPQDNWLGAFVFIKINAASLNVKSIDITKSDFETVLGEVMPDDRFWVKAIASSGCSETPDSFEVTVFSENDPAATAHVMLTETGPNTLEFRSSAEGLTLANLLGKTRRQSHNNHGVSMDQPTPVGTLQPELIEINPGEPVQFPEFETPRLIPSQEDAD